MERHWRVNKYKHIDNGMDEITYIPIKVTPHKLMDAVGFSSMG